MTILIDFISYIVLSHVTRLVFRISFDIVPLSALLGAGSRRYEPKH